MTSRGNPFPAAPVRQRLFSYAGNKYEIDLSAESAEEFHKNLGAYASAGRKVTRTKTRETRVTGASKNETGKIRTWAAANGLQVNPRGRVPQAVMEAYANSHTEPAH